MNENPLGALQGTSSRQFHLNSLDLQKAGRMVLVQIIGLFVTLARRFLTGAPKT